MDPEHWSVSFEMMRTKIYPLADRYSEEYRQWARYYLWRKFPDVQQVDAALQLSNGHLLPAFKQLTATHTSATAGKKGNRCFRVRIHRGSGGIYVLRTKQKSSNCMDLFYYF